MTTGPKGYSTKFAEFIKMCESLKAQKVDHIIIHHPQVLGDNYEEIVESLQRLADAELVLHIVQKRNERK